LILDEEKRQLEIQLNNSIAKNESLRSQIQQIELDFVEMKSKILNYEKGLENVNAYFSLF
jgi:hypothetical protein